MSPSHSETRSSMSKHKKTMISNKDSKKCICCRYEYKRQLPRLISPSLQNAMDEQQLRGSLFGLLCYLDCEESLYEAFSNERLDSTVANRVADLADATTAEFIKGQSPRERNEVTSRLALFEPEEVQTGRLLGKGGFSSVYEIESFHLPPEECPAGFTRTMAYSNEQKAAREFLARNVLRKIPRGSALRRSSSQSERVGEVSIAAGPLGNDPKDPTTANAATSQQTVARYAMKHLKPSLVRKPVDFAKAAKDLASEGEILLRLDHPNIIKIRGWSSQGTNGYRTGAPDGHFLILDRLTETLQDRIWSWRLEALEIQRLQRKAARKRFLQRLLLQRNRSQRLRAAKNKDEEMKFRAKVLLLERLKVALDMASAFEYLHEKHIIHRDIKPGNVGFDVRGEVKVFDFGLGRILPSFESSMEEPTFNMSPVGTRKYSAPEVTAKKPYNLKADVYSFGVLLWEMFSLNSPMGNHQERTSPGLSPCKCWSPALKTLIQQMMTLDFRQRPTMASVRETLKDLLTLESSKELEVHAAAKSPEKRQRRRSSTFRLEPRNKHQLLDLEGVDLTCQESHTSLGTIFVT